MIIDRLNELLGVPRDQYFDEVYRETKHELFEQIKIA